jgi:hypothetical protein
MSETARNTAKEKAMPARKIAAMLAVEGCADGKRRENAAIRIKRGGKIGQARAVFAVECLVAEQVGCRDVAGTAER